jgi:3-methyladenine DNA glycosylase AlkD
MGTPQTADIVHVIDLIRDELAKNTDEKTLDTGQRFFKEAIDAYGVKIPVVQQISKNWFREIKSASKLGIFALCEMLFQSGKLEEFIIACYWSHGMRKQFVPDDFQLFERWIEQYITNWATCGTFCNYTMGAFLEEYPGFLPELKRFAHSGNRWMRRAASVSLIVPARQGMFLQEIFEIADLVLEDDDDLVRKGYGCFAI